MTSEAGSPYSAPCMLGGDDPEIDPGYLGLQPENPMRVVAGNTVLYCAHWQATEHFYRHVMQFEESFAKDGWFVEFRVREGAHLSIADEARCTIAAAGGKGITLSFKVERLAAAHRYFTAQGIEPTPIRSHSWRAPYFFVYDPEGNRIELWNDRVDD